MSFNIAIDGPAGAGKSTIARMAAKKLGFLYVDTGAMYRAIALGVLRRQIDPQQEKLLEEALETIHVTLGYEDGMQQVYLNGENISGLIRAEEVGVMASTVASKGIVRTKLADLQKDLAAHQDVIMDGRDIGTVILPHAQLKLYLTASVETRAQRRYEELKAKGADADLNQIQADIRKRDTQDMNRAVAPLRQAEDAILIDSSDMTIDEVTGRILELARARMQHH